MQQLLFLCLWIEYIIILFGCKSENGRGMKIKNINKQDFNISPHILLLATYFLFLFFSEKEIIRLVSTMVSYGGDVSP